VLHQEFNCANWIDARSGCPKNSEVRRPKALFAEIPFADGWEPGAEIPGLIGK